MLDDHIGPGQEWSQVSIRIKEYGWQNCLETFSIQNYTKQLERLDTDE